MTTRSDVPYLARWQAGLGRRPPRHGRLARSCGAWRRALRDPDRRPRRGRSAPAGGGRELDGARAPAGRGSRGRDRRRHPRQRHAAGRIPLRQPDDRDQHHPRGAARGVEKLLFLGSSCIYPRLAPQPIDEEALLTGPLEPTNEWYAVAKIAGIKLCQAYRRQYGSDFISAMPTNLYGPRRQLRSRPRATSCRRCS